MREFFSRNLVIEIFFAAIICALLWMVTCVQPNGELSNTGYELSLLLQNIEDYVSDFFSRALENVGIGSSAPENVSIGSLTQPRNKYEIFIGNGFCRLASFASVYVQNSSALSYFVVIPAFLILLFAYNKASPDHFSRPARVIFSTTLIVMIAIVTFKVIEIQGVHSEIAALSVDKFEIEFYDYGCEAYIAKQVKGEGTTPLSLFLGNLSAFLSEVRLYLLGLVLWVIGKEYADIRRMQRLAAATPREGKGNE